MRRSCVSCLTVLWAAFTLHAAHADVDKVKLRQLAQLPIMDLSCMVGYTSEKGYVISTFLPADPPDPAAMRKSLRGDRSDAPRQLAIGLAYAELKDSLKAFTACTQAARLYQQQVSADPRDADAYVGLARAQWMMRDPAGAETTLAKALQIRSGLPQAWSLKAALAIGRVSAILHGPSSAPDDIADTASLKAYQDKHPLTPAEFRQANDALEEANADVDKMVQAAPEQGRWYVERGTFRSVYASVKTLLAALQADPKQVEAAAAKAGQVYAAQLADAATVADMFQGARLSREDAAAQGTAIGWALLSALSHRASPEVKGDKLLQSLPDTRRKDVEAFLARLQSLSESPNKQTAVTADNYLGALRLLMDTPEDALPPLRRALQLSPADRQANDLTICALTTSRHMEELAAVLEQNIKTRPQPILRLLLIKTYQKLNRSDAAEREVRSLVHDRPDDLTANLFLTALLMMRSDVETNLQEVGEQMRKTAELAQKGIDRNDWLCAGMLRGIYLVLTDHVEEAREQFKSMLTYDSSLEEPKSALSLLGSN